MRNLHKVSIVVLLLTSSAFALHTNEKSFTKQQLEVMAHRHCATVLPAFCWNMEEDNCDPDEFRQEIEDYNECKEDFKKKTRKLLKKGVII
jgi:hypothetical protein